MKLTDLFDKYEQEKSAQLELNAEEEAYGKIMAHAFHDEVAKLGGIKDQLAGLRKSVGNAASSGLNKARDISVKGGNALKGGMDQVRAHASDAMKNLPKVKADKKALMVASGVAGAGALGAAGGYIAGSKKKKK